MARKVPSPTFVLHPCFVLHQEAALQNEDSQRGGISSVEAQLATARENLVSGLPGIASGNHFHQSAKSDHILETDSLRLYRRWRKALEVSAPYSQLENHVRLVIPGDLDVGKEF